MYKTVLFSRPKVDQKRKKKSKRNNQTVLIYNDRDLSEASICNTAFRLDSTYTKITIPDSSEVPITPIMESLYENTTVDQITFVPRIWSQKDLLATIRCLSCVNRGVKRLMFNGFDFEPNFIEALTKILKLNRYIKKLEFYTCSHAKFMSEGFKRLCDGLEYTHFEELVLTSSPIPADQYPILFEALKYNQTIKSLRLVSEPITGAPFNVLCSTLLFNTTITDLQLGYCRLALEDYIELNQVLKSNNSIKKFALTEYQLLDDALQAISEGLKANTSLIELVLTSAANTNWSLIGDIVNGNKALKILNISENRLKPEQFQLLNLGSNVTLKELNLAYCWELNDYKIVFNSLMKNRSLTRLEIGHTGQQMDKETLLKFLLRNPSLIEFKIHTGRGMHMDNGVIEALITVIKFNRTLRKLSIAISRAIPCELFRSFIEALKTNETLTEVHDFIRTAIPFIEGPQDILPLITDLAKTNKTLRYVTGSEQFPYLEERLKENRETQDKIIHDTCTFINMIVMKPQSFILPIEVWLHVFKYVSYSFRSFDFGQYLLSLLNKT